MVWSQGSACKIFRKLQILHFTKNLEADFTFYILQGPVKKSDFTFYKLQGSVKTSFYKLHFTEFYRILQDLTNYILQDFTRFYRILQDFTRFYKLNSKIFYILQEKRNLDLLE